MKRTNFFLNLAILLTVIIFFATIDDFLSLHDIKKDYISKSALEYLKTETTKQLPDWTDTKLEWASLTISWVVKVVFICLLFVVILNLKNRFKEIVVNQPLNE